MLRNQVRQNRPHSSKPKNKINKKQQLTKRKKPLHRTTKYGLSTTLTSTTIGQLNDNQEENLATKKWAVSWGCSLTNGLGYTTEEPYECHPRRVALPRLAGQLYTPFQPNTPARPLDSSDERFYAGVTRLSTGWTTSLAVTDEGRVFTWGYGTSTRTMVKRRRWEERVGTGLMTWFSSFGGSTRGPQEPMRVPLFGCENDEQLKQEIEASGITNFPSWLTAKRMKAVKVQTHADNRGVLTNGGHLFTWSDVGDGYGSIGHGGGLKSAKQPTLIPIPDVVDFAFGYNHLLIVTAQGQVWASGNAATGAVGLPLAYLNLDSRKRVVFRPLSIHQNFHCFIEDFTKAYATADFNTDTSYRDLNEKTVKEDAKPHHNEYKLLGKRPPKIDLSKFDTPKSKLTTTNSGITKRQEITTHGQMRVDPTELMVNISKNVSWRGTEAIVGSVDPINQHADGKLPLSLPKMKGVSAGFAHSLYLDEHGDVWSSGKNSHGELGQVHAENASNSTLKHAALTPVDFRLAYYPQKVTALAELGVKAAKVSAGLHHSAVLGKDGNVYTFGSNEYGQCGRLNEIPTTISDLTPSSTGTKSPWALPPGKINISPSVLNGARIVDITCGFYDTALVLSDGRCLVMGSYLSRENKPNSLFSLQEFEPTDHKKNATKNHNDDNNNNDDEEYDSDEYTTESEDDNNNNTTSQQQQPSRYLVQSLSTRDLIPKQWNLAVQQYEAEQKYLGTYGINGVLRSSNYFLSQVAFGWNSAVGLAIPRHLRHNRNNNNNSNNNKQLNTTINGGNNNSNSNNNNNTTSGTTPIVPTVTPTDLDLHDNLVDPTLLGDQDAYAHQRKMENIYVMHPAQSEHDDVIPEEEFDPEQLDDHKPSKK